MLDTEFKEKHAEMERKFADHNLLSDGIQTSIEKFCLTKRITR